MGVPVPLLPLHLLWINLVTDGAPALALATDRSGNSSMHSPPRQASEPILRRQEWRTVLFGGALQRGLRAGCLRLGVGRAESGRGAKPRLLTDSPSRARIDEKCSDAQ
ncbi:MAG: cation transporting ATPase C-terminal domain-containing protein [Steroidobacteraceae bacterium]